MFERREFESWRCVPNGFVVKIVMMFVFKDQK